MRPAFILDVHLARLAKHLRLLGFDSLWQPNISDPELVRIHGEENRILLSRDRGIFRHYKSINGHFVENIEARAQLEEVLERYDLRRHFRPFTVCLVCNGSIENCSAAHARPHVPPYVAEHFDEFFVCGACERIFWRGSHYEKMTDLVRSLSF